MPLLASAPEAVSDRSGALLGAFAPTTLAELDAVTLLDRIDTKFLLPASRLASVLAPLTTEYRVLDINGVRQHAYHTRYFDTPAFECFHDHLSDQDLRHKMRSRTYVDSGLTFLEVKTRTDTGRTIKSRRRMARPLTRMTAPARSFFAKRTPFDATSLQPTVQNQFQRITLVHRHSAERLTVDVGIRFNYEKRTVILPGIAIAEVKRADRDQISPFLQHMHAASIEPTRISKYCVGVALLHPHVPHADLEPTLLTIATLIQDTEVRAMVRSVMSA
jgi:hypothetical protein